MTCRDARSQKYKFLYRDNTDISEKISNEGEDMLEKVLNEVLMLQMLLFLGALMVCNESLVQCVHWEVYFVILFMDT